MYESIPTTKIWHGPLSPERVAVGVAELDRVVMDGGHRDHRRCEEEYDDRDEGILGAQTQQDEHHRREKRDRSRRRNQAGQPVRPPPRR